MVFGLFYVEHCNYRTFSGVIFPAFQNSTENVLCLLCSFAQRKANPGVLVEASANASLDRDWDWSLKLPFTSTNASRPSGSRTRKSGVYLKAPLIQIEHGSYIRTSQPIDGANLSLKRSSA